MINDDTVGSGPGVRDLLKGGLTVDGGACRSVKLFPTEECIVEDVFDEAEEVLSASLETRRY